MSKSDRTGDVQFGALPYRAGLDGIEIMLITSRGSGRWIIPKGWPLVGKKPHRAAQIEAFQEAGIKGLVQKKAVGAYPYNKIMDDGTSRLCMVEVFPLRVLFEKGIWRESTERERAWFIAHEAAAAVEEGGLAQIIEEWALGLVSGAPIAGRTKTPA